MIVLTDCMLLWPTAILLIPTDQHQSDLSNSGETEDHTTEQRGGANGTYALNVPGPSTSLARLFLAQTGPFQVHESCA